MLAENAIIIYTLISFILSLITNVIFYRIVFQKFPRRKANLFAWLSSLGVMLIVNIALYFPFTINVEARTVASRIAFELFKIFVIPLIIWLLPTTIFILFRVIVFASTKKEQDAKAKSIEEAVLLLNENG